MLNYCIESGGTMSLYYIADLYKDVDYKTLIEYMFEISDSFYLRVSRSRIGDKYNNGRDDFLNIPKCIISESSRSKYYADMHFLITPELKNMVLKYLNKDGLCAFGFYKDNLRILCVEEASMTYIVLKDEMHFIKTNLLNKGIKLDRFSSIMEPWVINEKSYEFYAKNPSKTKDIKYLMG